MRLFYVQPAPCRGKKELAQRTIDGSCQIAQKNTIRIYIRNHSDGLWKLYKYKLVKMFSLLGKKYDCFVKVINAKVNITKIIMEV